MVSPPSTSQAHILLVEGPDDKHVIRHLRDRHQPTPTFSISDKEGITNLLPSISPEIKASERRAVGIVVDANDDLNARWDAVTHHLRRANIQAPSSPDPTGTIIDDRPRVGIWLMPDNTAPGELEDFVMRMIPAGDPIWPRSQSLYRRYSESREKVFRRVRDRRAQLYAWLAAREDPRRMGSAIGCA